MVQTLFRAISSSFGHSGFFGGPDLSSTVQSQALVHEDSADPKLLPTAIFLGQPR